MNIGDTIFYLINNEVHSAPILSKVTVENNGEPFATEQQREFWRRFGPSGIRYATCHGVISALNAFSTREKLLESL